jgi:hypothetical protein
LVFVFIESAVFDRLRTHYLDDDEYGELQQFMMLNPEAGAIVRGSGGVRKLRWRREGAGKRGGLRLVYFVRYQPNEFWMLTLYSKTEQENVPAHILKRLKELFEHD